jgi:hypothetical protein
LKERSKELFNIKVFWFFFSKKNIPFTLPATIVQECNERSRKSGVDGLTAFGLFAVTAMLVCYALEDRSHWFILAFAGACVLGSTYGFLQGAWPFGLVEAVWSLVALRRWWV